MIERYVPESLRQVGPFDVAHWQWLALAAVVVVAWVVGYVVVRLVLRGLRNLAARTTMTWDDLLLARVRGPLTLVAVSGLVSFCTPWIQMPSVVTGGVRRVVVVTATVGLFWGLLRLIDIAASVLVTTAWAQETSASRTLIPIGSRITKVAVAAFAVAAALSLLGLPVASIVAGLGVGGLAVALAAQKTFENLLGAFAIGVDQPIKEGDFVKVDDFTGTVERVGIRSTQFRTLDRTIVTLPNGQLAEKRLETFAARDRIRLHVTLGLVYSTTQAQMREVMKGIERVIRAHELTWQDNVIVRFVAFNSSSLDIEVMAWIKTADFDVFSGVRTQLFLEFMGVIEEAGSGFAFPTRTLHVESLPLARVPADEPRAAPMERARFSGER